MRGFIRVREDPEVLGRHGEPALLGRRGRIVDGEEAGDGLLLEPLDRVPRMDVCGLGQFSDGQGAAIGQGLVEVQAGAQVDP